MNLNQSALTELAKSFGRFMWFGILGLVATFASSLLTNQDLMNSHLTVGGMSFSTGVLIFAGVTAVIKMIDRYRHVDEGTDSKGIAPKFLQD